MLRRGGDLLDISGAEVSESKWRKKAGKGKLQSCVTHVEG